MFEFGLPLAVEASPCAWMQTFPAMMSQGALKNFAEKSGGLFISTPGGAAMRQAFKNIVEELGVQYTLGYQPSNSKTDGKWRAIEIKVSRPNLDIRTRKGYYGLKK